MNSESEWSYYFHQSPKRIPFLISPLLLRRRNLGQIDVSFFEKHKIYLIECKGSLQSRDHYFLSKRQWMRQIRTQHFIKVLFSRYHIQIRVLERRRPIEDQS